MKTVKSLLFVMALAALSAGAHRAAAAAITLPAASVFAKSEGTFEIWFRPDGGLNATPQTAFYSPMGFWTQYTANGRRESEPSLMYRIQKRKRGGDSDPSAALLQVEGMEPAYRRDLFFRMGDVVMTIGADRLKWEEGKWQCLAVTWQQQGADLHLQIYANGRLAHQLRRPNATDLKRDGELVIGSRNAENAPLMTLAAYRFSGRALGEEELAAAATAVPVLTADTLALETFAQVPPAGGEAVSLPSGGVLSGAYKVVPGPNGPALQMYDR